MNKKNIDQIKFWIDSMEENRPNAPTVSKIVFKWMAYNDVLFSQWMKGNLPCNSYRVVKERLKMFFKGERIDET